MLFPYHLKKNELKIMKSSKYIQVQKQILDHITENRLPYGSALPAEKRFAEMFGVSIHTVRRALATLADNGLIDRRHGQGTFVGSRFEVFEPCGTVTFLYITRFERKDREEPSNLKEYANTLDMESGMGMALKKHGYQMRIMLRGSNPSTADAERLKDSSGIVVSGWLDDDWLTLLKSLNQPILVVGNTNCRKLPFAGVEFNWRLLAVRMGRFWLEKQSRKIGLIVPGQGYAPSTAIRDGFRHLMNTFGGGYDPSDVLFTEENMPRREIWDFLDRRMDFDTVLVEHGLYPAVLENLWERNRKMRIGVLMEKRIGHPLSGNIAYLNFSENIWLRAAGMMVRQIAMGTYPIDSFKIAPSEIKCGGLNP